MTQGLDDLFSDIARGFLALFGPWSEHVEELHWAPEGEIQLLKARTHNGSIAVNGSHRDDVEIKAWKTVRGPTEGAASAFAPRVYVQVEHRNRSVSVRSFHARPPLGFSVFVRYEMEGPRRMDADLYAQSGGIQIAGLEGAVEAEARSGNIELAGCIGPATLYTARGHIRVTDVDGAVDAESGDGRIEMMSGVGEAHVRTTHGDIVITGMMGAIKAKSHSGNLVFHEGQGRATLETTQGNITATLRKLQQASHFFTETGSIKLAVAAGQAPLEVEAVEGDIDVALPAGFIGQLDAGSQHGTVRCLLPLTEAQRAPNLLVGQLNGGGGEGSTVRLRTFNGDVLVRAYDETADIMSD